MGVLVTTSATAIERLEALLRESGVAFTERTHPPVVTAQEVAATLHMHGRAVAKAVVLFAEGSACMAVVSAAGSVDLEAVGAALGTTDVRLAHEEEFTPLFADCEPGAMPPVGALYGLPTVIDERLCAEAEVAIQGGTHTTVVVLRGDDLARVGGAVVAAIEAPLRPAPAVAAPALPEIPPAVEVGPAAVPAALDLATVPAMGAAEVYDALGSGPRGLDEAEAASRLRRVGPNVLDRRGGPGRLRRLAAQFVHLFAILLWVGAALAMAVGEWALGGAIAAVVVVNGVFGFWQEHRAQRAVDALARLLPETAVVVRAGRERSLPAADLVPGDLLVVAEGDRVSVDARLVDVADVRVDESPLTGESHPVHKGGAPDHHPGVGLRHAHNIVFAGTTLIGGRGRAVVLRTGMSTEFGRIARLTQSLRETASPLQREVVSVARRVALMSVVMGAAFFGIGHAFAGLSLRDGAVFAIGIVLGNVPEGLLPTMTLSLAMAVQRMARRQAIVKRLSSAETLGSCSVICTDKTGTVTANEMTVRELWVAGDARAVLTGSGYHPEGDLVDAAGVALPQPDRTAFTPLLRIAHMCNAARLVPPDAESRRWRIAGDPTEGALLVAAAKAGLDRDRDLRMRPEARELAFDSRRKRMSTVHHALRGEGALVAYVKGAPRELLGHCTQALVDGREVPLDDARLRQALAENDRMARSGLRVLGMAYRYLPEEDAAALRRLDPGHVERDLVFVGLAAMRDPPRPEVRDAVARCHGAGIRVVMITGDYGLTAEAVAREVGILREDRPTRVVDDEELDALGDDALERLLDESDPVFARATPEQKLRIVTTLQRQGHVVAVTGDGVNDAPALKRADIGVAMGVSGTDVAREAADMVLLDDNFATIVAAVEEGRAIFDNMRKFIVYIFAHLSPEAIPFAFFAVFHTPLPLTVMQILAIDLGTETLPALALGAERAEPDVMRRPPRARGTRLLDAGTLLRGYAFLGGMTTAVVLGAFLLFLAGNGWHWGDRDAPTTAVAAGATTIVFLGIVVMQVGNAFACRTERASAFAGGLFSNRMLLWGIAAELLFAAALVYVPALQSLFGTAALGWWWWLLLGACVVPVFLAEEARKRLRRR